MRNKSKLNKKGLVKLAGLGLVTAGLLSAPAFFKYDDNYGNLEVKEICFDSGVMTVGDQELSHGC